MSEPKLISPMLDGYIMGAPLSNHDGVCCCPAMKENSDNKYIVKIISVPSSQSQLDALLLTGAYKDAADAMAYFKECSDGVVEEAEFLRKLSKLEGFLPYEDWQVVPMEGNDLGYDVYLISPYRLSLEKYMRRNLMTHLNAVNLGLDLCAAAAICRSSGRMYVDIKPTNIFISEDKEYRLGDLGFMKMDSLKFNSMPSKYVSRYTAPEVLDPMSTLNDSVDVYAIGLVLYQIYNNGELPFGGNAVAEVFPAPVNADYEMAEILAKACAPDPKDRWKDPIEMGQALVDYMQRNTVNDTPIAPPVARIIPEEAPAEAEEVPAQEEAVQEETPVEEISAPEAEEVPEELAFMEEMVIDDTAPGEEDADYDEPVTEEVSSILAQADDLMLEEDEPAVEEITETILSQETVRVPAAVIAGAEADIPADEPEEEDIFASFFDEDDDSDDEYDEYDDEEDYGEDDGDALNGDHQPKKKTWVVFLIVGILLALMCFGGFYLYRNFYIQTIDSLTVQPEQDQVTVFLDSDISDSLLTVSCTDAYGNSMTQPVQNGQAIFTGLQPNTHYRVEAKISGAHKLEGSTSVSFTSEEQTKIVSFTAVTGPLDGSVVLEFSVEGHEAQDWTVQYATKGEEPKVMSFTGYMVTINGLTVGKSYTFTLQSAADLYLVGDNTLQFTASGIVLADDLKISAITGDSLTAQWAAPEGTTVESWTVRCYSDTGYDETVTVTDTTASFTGLTAGDTYTVEVTAAGMTQPVRTTLTAAPITVNSITVDDSDDSKLVVSWDFTGDAPEGDWLLMYTLDNGESKSVVTTQTNSAEISPQIPGATYNFELQTAASGSVFNGTYTYSCPNAEVFKAHSSNVSYWSFDFCRAPEKEDWTVKNLKAADYVNSFTADEKIGLVMSTSGHYIPDVNKEVLYVIRDANGNVVPELIAQETENWKLMWLQNYPKANLTLPKTPSKAGEYKLYLYFDGAAVAVLDFVITE